MPIIVVAIDVIVAVAASVVFEVVVDAVVDLFVAAAYVNVVNIIDDSVVVVVVLFHVSNLPCLLFSKLC